MGGFRELGLVALLAAACSSPNPAFDPLRKNDTDPVGVDVDTGVGTEPGSTSVVSTDDGVLDDTGMVEPTICPDMPMNRISLQINRDGAAVQRCGAPLEGLGCWLERVTEPVDGWHVSGCCLADECTGNESYSLVFEPTPPDNAFSERQVKITYEFSPIEAGCELRWVQIVDDPISPEVPELLYVAARGFDANAHVLATAEQGDAVAGLCECGAAEASCCPPDRGLHDLQITYGLHLSAVQSHLDPPYTEPFDQTYGFEVNVVRAWQAPRCEVPPENEWVVRRVD